MSSNPNPNKVPRIVRLPSALNFTCKADVIVAPGFAEDWRKEAVQRKVRSYAKLSADHYQQCTHIATIQIGQNHYCTRHAGLIALAAALSGEELPQPTDLLPGYILCR